MKWASFVLGAIALSSSAQALPNDINLLNGAPAADILAVRAPLADAQPIETNEELFKRKGGGGGGGRGGGGGGGGRGGGSSGTSRGGSSSSSSGSRGGSSPSIGGSGGLGGLASNPLVGAAAGAAGGWLLGNHLGHNSERHREERERQRERDRQREQRYRAGYREGQREGQREAQRQKNKNQQSGGSRGGTGGSAGRPGSGIGPGYGGGRYYGGGAAVPYKSGTRSRGGISPLALGAGVGLGFGLYGLWLYSVYAYPYRNQWSYFNQTSNQQERKPVVCLCQENSDCGCDENEDQEYIKSLIGDGSYEGLNKTLISVAPYPEANDQLHIIINGTLPEGTEEAANFENTGMSLGETAMRSAGVWAVAALVGTAVFFG